MQYDPDLRVQSGPSSQNPQPGQPIPMVVGGPGSQQSSGSVYSSSPSGNLTIGSILMILFAVFNLIFLIVAAAYSVGIYENVEASSNATSFFVLAVMTFISGGLGLFCAYVGSKLSTLAQSPVLINVCKALSVSIIALSVLVLVGPIFK